MSAEDNRVAGQVAGQSEAPQAAGVEALAASEPSSEPSSEHEPAGEADHARNVVEAALLAAGKALTLNDLAQLFEEHERPAPALLREALGRLQQDYAQRSLEIKETASGFRIQVRSRYAGVVARLWPERPQRYSRALLETLALIAYRQPITRAEIEAVRGVAVNPNIVKTLLERGWIRVVGHRDLPGRPELLGTTREFLDYFGLRGLDELPPLAQLRNLGELEPQIELPVAADVPASLLPPRGSLDEGADDEADDESEAGEGDGESGAGDEGTVLVAAHFRDL